MWPPVLITNSVQIHQGNDDIGSRCFSMPLVGFLSRSHRDFRTSWVLMREAIVGISVWRAVVLMLDRRVEHHSLNWVPPMRVALVVPEGQWVRFSSDSNSRPASSIERDCAFFAGEDC